MNQPSRVLLLLLFFCALAIAGLALGFNPAGANSTASAVIFTGLIMASFVVLLMEHWFTKPTDAIATAISVLLVIVPSWTSLSEMGPILEGLAAYSAAILIIACASILARSGDPSERRDRVGDFLARAATKFGSGKALFIALFLGALFTYVDKSNPHFAVLSVYAALILALDAKKLPSFFLPRKPSAKPIGEVIGVQSRNTILARLAANRPTVRRYDFVEFTDPGDASACRKGLIIDNWVLNSQQWVKIFSNRSLAETIGANAEIAKRDAGKVYLINPAEGAGFLERFVGTIYEGSTIENVKFDYGMKVPITEGTLLQVPFGQKNVLYQVTNAVTKIEKLESQNEAGLIIGAAAQVGYWDGAARNFEKYGWLPEINKPVSLADDIPPVEAQENEYVAGKIPGTNFPIFLNKFEAISHHIAVLGVTGTGKSVFTRDLIRRLSNDNVKVIIVDFTEEYRKKFDPNGLFNLLEGAVEQQIYTQVEILGKQMDQFPNNRNPVAIDNAEQNLRQLFGDALNDFSHSDRNIAILALPDVSNSNAILSFTRWALKTLFEKARAGDFGQQRFSVVLEEAHTVVPEWNFVSSEDKSAKALINQIGQIALQGRKYGVGFVIVAQRTANVSKTVLTQCNSVIAFKQFDKTGTEFLSNYTGDAMAAAVSNLPTRRAIVVGKAFSSNSPVIVQIPDIEEIDFN